MIASLHKVLFIESNPIPVKWALHENGFNAPDLHPSAADLAEPTSATRCVRPLRQTGVLA
jgi:4-hydroxy-tetrahydrodipicolinate synthase